jgi:hypothetical protein
MSYHVKSQWVFSGHIRMQQGCPVRVIRRRFKDIPF